jgi:mono/diheme cytochrome c family protein
MRPENVVSSQQPWTAPAWADTIKNIDYPEEPLTLPLGEELYYFFCLRCHGEQGYGNGRTADSLKTKPANFNTKNFTDQSDGAIYWKITTGRGEMPSFKERFGEAQMWQTIAYLRYITKQQKDINSK